MDIDKIIESLPFGTGNLGFSNVVGHAFFTSSLSDKPYSVKENKNDKYKYTYTIAGFPVILGIREAIDNCKELKVISDTHIAIIF